MSDNSTALLSISYLSGVEQQIMLATGLSKLTADVLLAILIFVASLLIAKIIKYLVNTVAPHLISKTQTTLDDEIIKAVNGPLQWFVVVIGVYIAIGTIESLAGSFNIWLEQLLLLAVIFIAAYLLSNIVNGLLNWYRNDIAPKTESDFDDAFLPFIQKVAGGIILVMAVLVALEQLDFIEITPLITGMGIIGIAVALAAKELLSNFFGSVAILSDRPYKVGDRVKIGGSDPGDVIEIGLRSTRMKTLDNRVIIVPNTNIANTRIMNYSMPDSHVVFEIKVGIAYGADVEKATRIMKAVALGTDGVLTDPGPTVHVTELGNFAVKLLMLVPVRDYKLNWVVPDNIYRQVLKQYKSEGIEISYPVTNVIIKGDTAGQTVVQPISPLQTIR